MFIQKKSGEFEAFDPKKLHESLKKAGASDKEAAHVIYKVQKEKPKSSFEVYQHTLSHALSTNTTLGLKYNLKQALQELGPSGFPFEQFIAELLRRQGWIAQTNLTLQGHCVTHEIDVEVHNEKSNGIIECKFRNQPGSKVDIKVPLYVRSRFLDCEENMHRAYKDTAISEFFVMIATNTKFTTDAITYGQCMGMKLLGWDFPEHGNIREMVIETGLTPITVIPHLSFKQKQYLITKGIVFCHQIFAKTHYLRHMGLDKKEIAHILEDIGKLCK